MELRNIKDEELEKLMCKLNGSLLFHNITLRFIKSIAGRGKSMVSVVPVDMKTGKDLSVDTELVIKTIEKDGYKVTIDIECEEYDDAINIFYTF